MDEMALDVNIVWCYNMMLHGRPISQNKKDQERSLQLNLFKLCLCTGVASSGNTQTLDWK